MTVTVEVVEVAAPVEKGDAARLDQKIRLLAGTVRDNLHKIAVLVEEAKQGQIHVALGFVSWTAYLADALGGQMDLSTDARRAVVELMSGHGASQRTIAQAVGVSQATVGRDIGVNQVNRNDSPVCGGVLVAKSDTARPEAKVTGLDGKAYSHSRPARKRPRSPLTEDADKLAVDLHRLNKKLEKLLDDDRFERNREDILNRLRPCVVRGLGLLNRLQAADIH